MFRFICEAGAIRQISLYGFGFFFQRKAGDSVFPRSCPPCGRAPVRPCSETGQRPRDSPRAKVYSGVWILPRREKIPPPGWEPQIFPPPVARHRPELPLRQGGAGTRLRSRAQAWCLFRASRHHRRVEFQPLPSRCREARTGSASVRAATLCTRINIPARHAWDSGPAVAPAPPDNCRSRSPRGFPSPERGDGSGRGFR